MDDPSGPTLLSIILGWLPMVILIGSLYLIVRNSKSSSPPKEYWTDLLKVEKESLESRRETNRLLAELTAKLER